MPMFLCPCCGEPYYVPRAFCEDFLAEKIRQGWIGTIAPVKCVTCQKSISKGDVVIIRKGSGLTDDGQIHELPQETKATVVEATTWNDEGSVYLVQLPTGKPVYVVRAQLALDDDENPN